MDNEVFLQFGLILSFTAVIATIMKALRQPLIIGYILTGIIVGPSVLDLFSGGETGELLARFGIALLLFIVGIGLNPKLVKDVGKVALVAGLGQVGITTAIGFGLAKLLDFSTSEALYLGFALAFSSTIVAHKLISDKRETSRLYARIVTGILLIQDVVATALLIVVAGRGEQGALGGELLQAAGFGLGLGLVLLFVSMVVLPRVEKFVSASQEYLFLFALAWGFGIASLFAIAGLSVEVGALFAGVALATQSYAQEVSSRLRPLRDFFVLLFFIILGAELQFDALDGALVPVLAFSLLVIVGTSLIVMALMGLMGYTKRTSFKSAMAVSQISEFSLVLVILAEQLGRIDQQIVSIVTLVGLVTIAVSTYLTIFDEKLYDMSQRYLSLFERRKVKLEQQHVHDADIVLFGYTHGGKELIASFEKLHKKFLVVDYNPDVIDELKQRKLAFAYGDANDSEFLGELNLGKVQLIISTITDYQTSLFITTQVRAVNEKAILIVHGEHPEHALKLYEHQATYVTMPRYISSERVSHMLNRAGLKKSDFALAREHHLKYVQRHLA